MSGNKTLNCFECKQTSDLKHTESVIKLVFELNYVKI